MSCPDCGTRAVCRRCRALAQPVRATPHLEPVSRETVADTEPAVITTGRTRGVQDRDALARHLEQVAGIATGLRVAERVRDRRAGELREAIQRAWETGAGYSRIARAAGLPRSTVQGMVARQPTDLSTD